MSSSHQYKCWNISYEKMKKSTQDKEKLPTQNTRRLGRVYVVLLVNEIQQHRLRKGLTFSVISVYIVQLQIWQLYSPFTCSSLNMQKNLWFLHKFCPTQKIDWTAVLMKVKQGSCKLLFLFVPKFLDISLNPVRFLAILY